jgi:hypothetical protein
MRATWKLLCLVVLAVGSGALTAANSVWGATPTIGLPDCLGQLTVKPRSVVLACGDGNFRLQSLQWTGWGETFAAARGIAVANDCTPNCAAGHFHSFPVLATVSGRQTCAHRPAYRTLTYAFPAAAPFHAKALKDVTYTLRCKT